MIIASMCIYVYYYDFYRIIFHVSLSASKFIFPPRFCVASLKLRTHKGCQIDFFMTLRIFFLLDRRCEVNFSFQNEKR